MLVVGQHPPSSGAGRDLNDKKLKRSQLRDQRLLSRESAPPQPRDHSVSASLSESVIHLISTCQQDEECLLSRANCISQPVDLRLLSPAISAHSAAKSVPCEESKLDGQLLTLRGSI